MIIAPEFYLREDVVLIARELLGKFLVTEFDGKLTSGIITETEAYAGVTDKASHAYGGRRTARTEIMYRVGGTAYIYLCYGVHSLFNVVTNKVGIPHAVLVRGIKPTEGLEIMQERRGKTNINPVFANGPGKVCKALGIHFSDTGRVLVKPEKGGENGIWIEDRGVIIDPKNVTSGPRVGVDYAGKDALLPYRFIFSG